MNPASSQPIVNAPLPSVVQLPLDSDNDEVEVIPDSDVITLEPLLTRQYPFYTKMSINQAAFKNSGWALEISISFFNFYLQIAHYHSKSKDI